MSLTLYLEAKTTILSDTISSRRPSKVVISPMGIMVRFEQTESFAMASVPTQLLKPWTNTLLV